MQNVEITAREARQLLLRSEDYYLDFKSRDIKPAGLEKWISAFGNSSGGEIFIGIDEIEPGVFAWNGFSRIEDANAHLFVMQNAYPPSDIFRYDMLSSSDLPGFVLRVTVNKTREICRTANGTIYRRAGAQVQAVDTDDGLRTLTLQKGITSWEDETVRAPITLITDSIQIKEFVAQALTFSEPEPWLRNQLMITEEKPTVAGIILFADEPQVALPKASVMVYRYASRDKVGARKDLVDGRTYNIEGSAMQQVIRTVKKTTELIETVMGSNLQPISYPPETLHEIITNAIIHRDYSIPDNVHVRIFDDRVEVESPGRLPGNVTPRNLPGARFSRNERIERMLHKFPDAPNKNVGEGMLTAFAAMQAVRLAAPVVTETEMGVVVFIKHEPLDSPATIVLRYLNEHDSITNREARQITNTESEGKMRRILVKLTSQGAIEQVPGTNKGGYKYRAKASVSAPDGSTDSAAVNTTDQ